MKVILDVNENKADFVMELLNSLPFIKVVTVNKKKEKFLKDLEESVDEVNLAIQGKVKLKSAEEILNEL
ncbi:MAG: hypothetical protein WAT22_00335 [Saprospiraceae bacterium]|jgi:hypothetical protein|nr:hypothetical protein [Saprospiraceae bacterium]MBK9565537.1 hypothetical protein [Saprospiraceae bacterium]MBP6445266.1 hypothetical protein [Saprospiraceae bacterium]